MSKSNWAALLAVVVLIIFAFVAVRVVYYGTGVTAYTPPDRELQDISLDVAAVSARKNVKDNPTVSKGVAVVDFAHDNALFVEELNTLFSKLVNRGYKYELVSSDQNDTEGETLIDRLRYAKALILPLPRTSYSAEEVAEIRRFVENGGRVLILGDPTRTIEVDALNSVAGAFGIIFANDYLYSLNQSSMDNNYRNVIYSNFTDSPVTAGLGNGDKVIFYSASSIKAPGDEIILGDKSTHSSTSESDRTLAAAALTTNGQVLALGDLTFFSEPYSAAESNGILINNIANFLTDGTRSYDLKDFPYFFNNNIDLVFKNTRVFNSQFEDAVTLKDALEAKDYKVDFTNSIGPKNDTIFIGRFDEADEVKDYLDQAGIVILDPPKKDETEIPASELPAENVADATPSASEDEINPEADRNFIEGRIQIKGIGELERGGSTLFYLNQSEGRNVMIILSDNPDTNADAFKLLLDNKLGDCVASDVVAVCQTEDPTGKMPPSLRRNRIDKILVVSDDSGRTREDKQTSAIEYQNILSDTYKVTVWETAKDGSPDLAELLEYDAIIWSTGDYWDDSIGDASAETLTKYIETGGNLILSGASIGFDWDHSDFLQNIVHADYLTFAEQKDLKLVLPDHPLARGFTEDQVIDLLETPSGEPLNVDVVSHTADARVIFERGPASDQSGAASVIAFEDERAKVAYYALPLYLIPPETRARLVKNTVDWFSRKPLELPSKDDYKPYQTNGTEKEASDQQQQEGAEQPADTGNNGTDNNGGDNGNGNNNGNNNGDNTNNNQQ